METQPPSSPKPPENLHGDSSNPPPIPQSLPENHLPDSQIHPPISQTTEPPPENHLPDSQIHPQTTEPPPENHLPDPPPPDETTLTSKKRRRRKKLFPEMISSAAAVTGLRILRPHVKSSVYNEKLMDEIMEMQMNDSPSKNRRRKMADLAREVDIEALIAISVGFPIDSLTEEEIEHNVVSVLGGAEQTNYIIVRNHILARWRSNVSTWMTRDHALESIRSEHRGLVNAAYTFLLEHGYINFGLAPPIKEVGVIVNGGEKGSVIIVGAGIAGLAAAKHLIMLGFRVVILEGRKRPGGRVRTRKMSGKGNVDGEGEGGGLVAAVDLGGSVLTGINGNPLGVLARQLGFPLHKVRDICPLYLPDGKAVDSEVDSRVEVSFNKLLDKVCKLREAMLEEVNCVDCSLGSALEAFRRTYQVAENAQERMLLDWHLANLEYANASLLSDLSMAFWDQDDPYEMGGDHCFIPGGNERFIRALANDIPIIYDQTVEKIQYGSDGIAVFAGGQVFRGDMALCTVPLGVLKKGSIQFVPELPIAKKEAIERIGFGLLNKVAMLFPYDFWGGEIDTFGHLTEDSSMRGEFFLFYSYSSVSGGPLLVALVAGESAVNFESMSPVVAVDRVLDILKSIFARKGIQVPNPVQVVCTRWGKDKFTYGSYSYVAIGASGDDYDILAESVGDGRLFFAGEATNRRYPATMHGALLSGLREAANILKAANKRSSLPIENTNNGREINNMEELHAKEDLDDLDILFQVPDISFGSFCVLFDPSSEDPDSTSIIRVGFGGNELASGLLYLYSLISRKQAIELSHLEGDGNRVRALNSSYGVSLVGRKSLGSVGESLIVSIKAARVNRDESNINGLPQT